MNTSNKALVDGIARSRIYRDFRTAFCSAMGLPVSITSDESWNLPLLGDPNESPFCRLMAESNKACATCLWMQDRLQKATSDESATDPCFSGLLNSAVPLKIGDKRIGFLRTGQVFIRKPTEADFEKTRLYIATTGIKVDAKELRAAYFATKVIEPEQYRGALRLLELFAEQLCALTNTIIVTEGASENPQISRAKDFIGENLVEQLSLAKVAQFAHMSTFYFCKKFKMATGLTYTEYVARLRIEKAKERLLDPNVRVSEVAFAVGFQSLSQFNRTFKTAVGESPTDYRRNIADHSAKAPSPTSATARTHDRAAAQLAPRRSWDARPLPVAAPRWHAAQRIENESPRHHVGERAVIVSASDMKARRSTRVLTFAGRVTTHGGLPQAHSH